MRSAASRSWYASSGFAWIARERANSASRRSSIALIARWPRALGSLNRRGAVASPQGAPAPAPWVSFRLMSLNQCEDHAIERAVSLLELERGLLGRERPAARDVRDLGHEARAEEEERLRRFTERQPAPLRLDPVFAPEDLGLRDELLATDRARRVEATEEQLAHANPALTEPAERILVEPRVPVLRHHIHADASSELGRDPVGRLAERRERLTAGVTGAREHRVDRGAQESPVPARCGEDIDLPVVGPAAKGVGVDAEDPARLPQRQPVIALERRCFGDTANLGESQTPRRGWLMAHFDDVYRDVYYESWHAWFGSRCTSSSARSNCSRGGPGSWESPRPSSSGMASIKSAVFHRSFPIVKSRGARRGLSSATE